MAGEHQNIGTGDKVFKPGTGTVTEGGIPRHKPFIHQQHIGHDSRGQAKGKAHHHARTVGVYGQIDQEAVFQAAKDEVLRGLRDDFDTLKVAWARDEATYSVSTAGNWRWWLDDGLTVDRRNRLQDCIKTVGGLVGWMARRFEDTMNMVVRYMSKPAQAEFKSEWIDALDRSFKNPHSC